MSEKIFAEKSQSRQSSNGKNNSPPSHYTRENNNIYNNNNINIIFALLEKCIYMRMF